MPITPTHLNYYLVCQRKLWLFSHSISMEQTSDTVYAGKLIGELSYPQRPGRYTELDLGVAKIDYYDAKNRVVHEVKKSDKMEEAHILQVKYYLYLLYQAGVKDAQGILEYPRLKKKQMVYLEEEDLISIPDLLKEVNRIIQQQQCPERLKKSFCKTCSYFEFCWSE